MGCINSRQVSNKSTQTTEFVNQSTQTDGQDHVDTGIMINNENDSSTNTIYQEIDLQKTSALKQVKEERRKYESDV